MPLRCCSDAATAVGSRCVWIHSGRMPALRATAPQKGTSRQIRGSLTTKRPEPPSARPNSLCSVSIAGGWNRLADGLASQVRLTRCQSSHRVPAAARIWRCSW